MSSTTPATKSTHEKLLMRLVRVHKLLRARDLAEQGLPTITLTRLVQAGKLDRVARGLYALPRSATTEHRSLAEVAIRVPKGVVCLLSALQFHELGTQAPFEVWLAIPNRVAAPRIQQPAIRIVRMSDDALTVGLQQKRIDGVEVPIFNPARTVVDCFKFRNKVGLDVTIEALREGWRERQFTMDELWHHATLQRVTNVSTMRKLRVETRYRGVIDGAGGLPTPQELSSVTRYAEAVAAAPSPATAASPRSLLIITAAACVTC